MEHRCRSFLSQLAFSFMCFLPPHPLLAHIYNSRIEKMRLYNKDDSLISLLGSKGYFFKGIFLPLSSHFQVFKFILLNLQCSRGASATYCSVTLSLFVFRVRFLIQLWCLRPLGSSWLSLCTTSFQQRKKKKNS